MKNVDDVYPLPEKAHLSVIFLNLHYMQKNPIKFPFVFKKANCYVDHRNCVFWDPKSYKFKEKYGQLTSS
jgi:hypothetical protein